MKLLSRPKKSAAAPGSDLRADGDGLRYCSVLASSSDAQLRSVAQKHLEDGMAIVPSGTVLIANTDAETFLQNPADGGPELPDYEIEVESYYIDRFAVSNMAFASFVQDGGYDNPEFWPDDIFPHVLQFVGRTGCPGPRFWEDGKPPKEKLNHPVVGVCWYEANAYGLWCGKRLPTCAEWQRAGTWAGEGAESRYPWGNAFDPANANLWTGGYGDTVPVDDNYDGATPNGIFQLTGNVWEWVGTLFECHESDGTKIVMDQPMAEIRGGAFDTYFPGQATCQFRSGQAMLRRSHNTGFRCCVSVSSIQDSSDPYAFVENRSPA